MTLPLPNRALSHRSRLHFPFSLLVMPKRRVGQRVESSSASPPGAPTEETEKRSNKRTKKTGTDSYATGSTSHGLPSTQTQATLNKKRKQLGEWLTPPYPDFQSPRPEVYQAVQDALYRLHPRTTIVTGPVGYDGEPLPNGELPNVLQTLVRVILSQNTNTTSEGGQLLSQ